MCVVTAQEAGVGELAVCSPPGPGGDPHPAILAACRLCEVEEVYRIGGAQAIAALAYGTETVPPVDVVVGPGSAHVQEAKRQLFGLVGLDGIAGPSELVVVASAGADAELAALDLLAQAEHGAGSLVALVSDSGELVDEVERALARAAADAGVHGGAAGGPAPALVRTPDPSAAIRVADLIAPEHLELMGGAVEALAGDVRSAGAVFVGRESATAFGDYVAGSNHVLPTGGAARYASALSPATFRRRVARVFVTPEAAAALAPAGAAIARAEGFPVHAESMGRRARRPE
jgi:histidinol dehydrogenase